MKFDRIDLRLLEELQRDGSLSQRALAERVGLSQNACWRRLKALTESGVIRSHTILLDRQQLGLGLVVFVMLRTRHHSTEWLATFRNHVSGIEDVVDFFRISGDYDYLLKIVTRDMASFDAIYRRLISRVELETVTSYFGMEAIEEQRLVPLTRRATG